MTASETKTKTKTKTKTCSQHPGGCRPWDRHTQSMRASDELIAAVAAKAEAMGLVKNDGLEIALEEWVGWREPGEKWKGPRRQAPGERKRPAAAPGSAVFMEPGGKPVIGAAVPEMPGKRNREGRKQ